MAAGRMTAALGLTALAALSTTTSPAQEAPSPDAVAAALRDYCGVVLERMLALGDDPRTAEELLELARIWRDLNCRRLLDG